MIHLYYQFEEDYKNVVCDTTVKIIVLGNRRQICIVRFVQFVRISGRFMADWKFSNVQKPSTCDKFTTQQRNKAQQVYHSMYKKSYRFSKSG